jgi:3-hydroxybutyryl-CoA dehydratase
MPTQLETGAQFVSQKIITEEDIKQFADISGDRNPLHLDAAFASRSIFKQRVAHGMLTASLVSTALASIPGTIILLQISLTFEKPVFIGDNLTAKVTVNKIENSKVYLDAEVTKGTSRVLSGTATILRK